MVGKNGSLLKGIKGVPDLQGNFDSGCSFHLSHVCAGKGAKNFVPPREIF